jgi:hypothetical protein
MQNSNHFRHKMMVFTSSGSALFRLCCKHEYRNDLHRDVIAHYHNNQDERDVPYQGSET